MDLLKGSKTVCRALAIVLLLRSFAFAAAPGQPGEMDVYFAAQHYVWSEFGGGGQRYLKESGELYGVGFGYHRVFLSGLTVKPVAELFGGTTDYDGQTQSGIPATTNVDYFGISLKGDIGRRFSGPGTVSLEPFGGLGIRAWLRNIRDGRTSTGATVLGYTEQWATVHARAGVRAGLDLGVDTRLFVEAAYKIPLYNENVVEINTGYSTSEVTIHPGMQGAIAAEAGVKTGHFTTGLFYEELRFPRSDNESISGGYVYQPRSTGDLIGFRIGGTF
jgi:hypothetical protein